MKVPDAVIKIKDLDLVEHMDYVQTILNRGLYQTRIFDSVPNWAANEGESAIYSTGTIRDLYFMINTTWCRVGFASTGSLVLFDSDGDTGITPEFSADEDVIRFYSANTYMFSMSTFGLSMSADTPVVFDGSAGDSKWVYDSGSSKLQGHVDGTLRIEM